MENQSTHICDISCPHYCPLDRGDVMCTKDSPRMIIEGWLSTGFFGWCTAKTEPEKEKPLSR